jgi:hypothetical protein
VTDRPYEHWGRTEWTVVGTLLVVVGVYVGASAAALADVASAGRVADVAAGALWLAMGAWLRLVFSGLGPRWRAVGAGGFLLAGVTEFASLFVVSGTLDGLNLLGLLVATAVLLVDLLGLR